MSLKHSKNFQLNNYWKLNMIEHKQHKENPPATCWLAKKMGSSGPILKTTGGDNRSRSVRRDKVGPRQPLAVQEHVVHTAATRLQPILIKECDWRHCDREVGAV